MTNCGSDGVRRKQGHGEGGRRKQSPTERMRHCTAGSCLVGRACVSDGDDEDSSCFDVAAFGCDERRRDRRRDSSCARRGRERCNSDLVV
ncbi:unnamed protein product [Linum trigynum]|uniref:Uncharacterized protein n=1 Tax=Linum trigynum TaxID=586398 RepID=A0AAV2FC62_9ROSI